MIASAGRPGRIHVQRMRPGEDVRSMLMAWCAERSIEAAVVVAAVGSLERATIRLAGRTNGHELFGDLEVCSLSGTLSRHGIHLHVTVSDELGTVTGGHLLSGCIVRTTLELAVQEVEGLRMIRRFDAVSGHEELVPEPIGP